MRRLAPGVWRLKELPLPTINIYLAEDVLIDAFAELEGRESPPEPASGRAGD